jgi:hypothetical protein
MLKDTGKILHNRFVLYFILFLALSDLLFLAMGREFVSIAVFILSGFVTSFFSKNMMVIMCVAMVISNILRYGTGVRMTEGLVSEETPSAEEKSPAEEKPSADEKSPAEEKPPTKETSSDEKTSPTAEIKLTEEDKRKFLENMEKIEMYEPLFNTMDKLVEKIGGLIGN